jgi:hypothetical protein
MEDAVGVMARSPLLLSIFLLFYLAEIAIASLCLKNGWDSDCDTPMRTWIVVYTCRLAIVAPLTIRRFYLANKAARDRAAGRFIPEEGTPEMQRTSRFSSWMNTMSFCWIIVAHFWYFQSHSCGPWLSKYVLAQIILFYCQLCLPLMLLLCICLCLPCALVLLHILAPRPGAKPEVINNLPTRTVSLAPGAPPPPEGEASCSICMEDYKDGTVLRILPCRHEFDKECVDQWLKQNPTCPLCRKHVGGDDEQHEDADDRV